MTCRRITFQNSTNSRWMPRDYGGLGVKTWINPMRPLFMGCSIPLPRPNHPVRALFQKRSAPVFVGAFPDGEPVPTSPGNAYRYLARGGWPMSDFGGAGRPGRQFWINPMRPSSRGAKGGKTPIRHGEPTVRSARQSRAACSEIAAPGLRRRCEAAPRNDGRGWVIKRPLSRSSRPSRGARRDLQIHSPKIPAFAGRSGRIEGCPLATLSLDVPAFMLIRMSSFSELQWSFGQMTQPTDAPETAPETIYVTQHRIACDGGGGPLGHPKVFLEMGQGSQVECPYCGRKFILKEDADAASH